MARFGAIPKPEGTVRRRNVSPRSVAGRPRVAQKWKVPSGEWQPESVKWWREACGSEAGATWVPADRSLLERGLMLVDQWWRLQRQGRALVAEGLTEDAARVLRAANAAHGQLASVERRLFLSPEDRLRGRVPVADGPAEPGTGGPTGTVRSMDSAKRWSGGADR